MSGPPILSPAVNVMKQMFAQGEDTVWYCSNVDLVPLQFIVVDVYTSLNLIVTFRLEHCSYTWLGGYNKFKYIIVNNYTGYFVSVKFILVN